MENINRYYTVYQELSKKINKMHALIPDEEYVSIEERILWNLLSDIEDTIRKLHNSVLYLIMSPYVSGIKRHAEMVSETASLIQQSVSIHDKQAYDIAVSLGDLLSQTIEYKWNIERFESQINHCIAYAQNFYALSPDITNLIKRLMLDTSIMAIYAICNEKISESGILEGYMWPDSDIWFHKMEKENEQ